MPFSLTPKVIVKENDYSTPVNAYEKALNKLNKIKDDFSEYEGMWTVLYTMLQLVTNPQLPMDHTRRSRKAFDKLSLEAQLWLVENCPVLIEQLSIDDPKLNLLTT